MIANLIVIDGLTRSGTTTFARLLGKHAAVKCLVEPFHPRRYNGHFHRMAIESGSVKETLALIGHRWNCVKHVWDARTGWPFNNMPKLNDELVLLANKLIVMERANLLQRHISDILSRRLDFWIGTKQEFLARLESVVIPALDSVQVRAALQIDRAALVRRSELLRHHEGSVMTVSFEKLYGVKVTRVEQLGIVNSALTFLGLDTLSERTFMKDYAHYLTDTEFKWSSEEVYRRIPNIVDLDREVGCDEFGHVFPLSV